MEVAVYLGFASFVFLLLHLFSKVQKKKKNERAKMEDGLADDDMIAVRYRYKLGEVYVPMRYIEYLEYWSQMDRKEKRAMVLALQKNVEKGKIAKENVKKMNVHLIDEDNSDKDDRTKELGSSKL